MPPQHASCEQSAPIELSDSARLYETIKAVVHSENTHDLEGASLPDIDGRLLNAVSINLITPFEAIKKNLDDALQTVKDIETAASAISGTAAKQVASMPERLKVDTISAIPSRVKMLLANFQNAVEDPRSLYPRLICCDAPVDPAQVVNFAKKHHLLDEMLREKGPDKSYRSMPSAPKSALDVITNVNSSLESMSDMLFESVDRVMTISENFESIHDSAKNLACIDEPVSEAMNHYEETRGMFQRIIALFTQEDDDDISLGSRSVGEAPNAMQIVMKASELLERLDTTRLPVDVVPQLQNAKAILSGFGKDFSSLLSRAEITLCNLISVLQNFIVGLPRITREMQQFFVPTGLKALVMKPSPDLISLLQSVDDLQVVLPEPDTLEKSSSNTIEAKGLDKKIHSLCEKFHLLDGIQQTLLQSIENQNLQKALDETVEDTLKSVLQDIQGSVDNIMDFVKEGIDPEFMAGPLEMFLGLRQSKQEKKGRTPAELVENVTSAGGLFGRLFGT